MSEEKKKITKKEKWSEVIRQLNLDLSKPFNYVTAKQIKNIAHEEPRLMAKMDTHEELPDIFKDNGVFLLPISRKEYVIVKGKGYQEIEAFDGNPTVHYTRHPFPSFAADIESEGIYLDYAHSCGLLEKLTGATVYPTIRNRSTTPRFTFEVDSTTVSVKGAQIEIDGGYMSRGNLILVEAKMGIPSSFPIRQLYYPLRAFCDRASVESLLFCYEPSTQLYMFWEYEFKPYTSFNSISLIRSIQFTVKHTSIIPLKEYQEVKPEKLIVPQADSVDKIIEFQYRTLEGHDTAKKMASVLGFTVRQSSYYRQAAEALGLVTTKGNRYLLTNEGERLTKMRAETRAEEVCKMLLRFPLMSEVFLQISVNRDKLVTKREIMNLIKRKSTLGGTTLGRRAQTIIAWFRWIQNNLGIVEVDSEGSVSMSRQLRLEV